MRGNISSGDHFHNIQFPEVVGVAQGSVGQLTPPKLRRFSHLPTLSASAQLHVRVVMMHILDTHHHKTRYLQVSTSFGDRTLTVQYTIVTEIL